MDLILVLGGDGTILHTVHRLRGKSVPLLGINFGKFGYLAEHDLDACLSRIGEVLAGKCAASRRLLLECRLGKRRWLAMNEAVMTRRGPRLLTLELAVGGKPATLYQGDGLIVATPTGTTAYAMSAGGPLCFPEMDALMIVPVCPHTLSVRPLVVPARFELSLSPQASCSFFLDGQEEVVLSPGEVLHLTRAPETVEMLHLSPPDFFKLLREKLGWRGSLV